jgi:hypothetical protein
MNEKLKEAEEALTDYLHRYPDGVTMDQILQTFRPNIHESELRAAIWTLRAAGVASFDQGKVFPGRIPA